MTTQRIAELEAEVMRLREALEHLEHNARKSGANMGLALDVAKQALSTPFTSTALPELIEKVEIIWREKCAAVCNHASKTGHDASDAWTVIRALPTGQIKLEELL